MEPKIGKTIFSLRDAVKFIRSFNQPPLDTLHTDDGKVYRECLLHRLESIKSCLSELEFIHQSSCFVFTDGKVVTFNGEVFCSVECDLDIEGAVISIPLFRMLRVLDEHTITIEQGDEEFLIKGNGRSVGVPLLEQILLPFDSEVDKPKKWHPLHNDFCKVVKTVAPCAGTDATKRALLCIHCHPDFLEATDNYQAIRFPLKTGFKKEILIRAESLKYVAAEGVSEYSETKEWVHFRNATEMVMSCRLLREVYPTSDRKFPNNGELVELPSGLKRAADSADVMAATDDSAHAPWTPTVILSLKQGVLRVMSEGSRGWHKEELPWKYDGPEMIFTIHASVLQQIARWTNQCRISCKDKRADCIVVDGEIFKYMTQASECKSTHVLGVLLESDERYFRQKCKRRRGSAAGGGADELCGILLNCPSK